MAPHLLSLMIQAYKPLCIRRVVLRSPENTTSYFGKKNR